MLKLNKMRGKIIISLVLTLFFHSITLSQIEKEHKTKVYIGLLCRPENDSIVVLTINKNDIEMNMFNIAAYGSAFKNKYFSRCKNLVPARSVLTFSRTKDTLYSIPIQDNAIYEEVIVDCISNVTKKIIIDELNFWEKSKENEVLIIECFVSNQKFPSNWEETFADMYMTNIRRITRCFYGE